MPQTSLNESLLKARELHGAGKLAEAERIYRQVLAVQPNHAGAMHLLGIVALQAGKLDAAIDLMRRSIALSPGVADYYCNLARGLHDKRELQQAAEAYRQAIRLKPDDVDAMRRLGIVLREMGLHQESQSTLRRAIEVQPDSAEAFNALGITLRDLRELDGAVAAYRESLRLRPGHAAVLTNLGIALCESGHLAEGVANCQEAVRLQPDHAGYQRNLGTALHDDNQIDASSAAYSEAIRLQPDDPEAHWNLGINFLLLGDFPKGWEEYEWRWKWKNFLPSRQRFAQPAWNGEDISGKTILLYDEQGIGDTIQFIRYVPVVLERGARVLLECQTELHRLLKNFPGVAGIAAKGKTIEKFDQHASLLSLARIFGTTPRNIPASIAYLHADAEIAERWRSRLAGPATRKIGVAWAGSMLHSKDIFRSLPPGLLGRLTGIPGTTFFSLQKGDAAKAAGQLNVVDYSSEWTDFADTAGLIANLDLVISVDTAVAHLAAAMGKPTWLLVALVPDWRWLQGREDTPWYSTMRLFRQTRAGDWGEVLERVAGAINLVPSSGTPGEG